MNGNQIQCTAECQKSLLKMNNTSSRLHFLFKSECGYSQRCLVYKHRFQRCIDAKIYPDLHRNYVPNGCMKSYNLCNKKSKCKILIREHLASKCNKLINGQLCTNPCKRFLKKLITVEPGFQTCICDGNLIQEGTCLGMKKNIQSLCLFSNES